MSQLIRSNIYDIRLRDKLFSFKIDTEISLIDEPDISGAEFVERRVESLTSNPESYKRELITPINLANDLRIAIINDVETVAIESADIIKNTSFLEDELVEMRLTFLPVEITDNSLIWDIWSADSFELTGELDVEADFDGYNVTSEMIKFEDDRIRCTPRLLIITLAKGQRLKCTVKTKKDIGRMGKKYSPVSTIGYEIINDRIVELTPKTKNKIPPLFILFYALITLEKIYPFFEFTIEGDKDLIQDENDNIIIG